MSFRVATKSLNAISNPASVVPVCAKKVCVRVLCFKRECFGAWECVLRRENVCECARVKASRRYRQKVLKKKH